MIRRLLDMLGFTGKAARIEARREAAHGEAAAAAEAVVAEMLESAEQTRMEASAATADVTAATDRQINQMVASASRQTDRVVQRALRSADASRRAAEEAFRLSQVRF